MSQAVVPSFNSMKCGGTLDFDLTTALIQSTTISSSKTASKSHILDLLPNLQPQWA